MNAGGVEGACNGCSCILPTVRALLPLSVMSGATLEEGGQNLVFESGMSRMWPVVAMMASF